MLGYADAEELVGQPYWTVLPPHERARVESYRTARLRGELAPAQYEVQVLRKDGSLLWVDILVSVVRWRSAPAILTTWIDITERKRAEEARARAEEQLREAQRMEAIGHLTGGVAHHFNNLLTVIIGRLDMAREALGATRPEISARLEKASDAARRGAELVRRLLAFARRQPLAPKMLDLNRVLADMSELLRRTVGESIEFEIRPGAGLWEVEVDPGQIELSLFHLALNAREAMAAGGTLRIETANVTLGDDGPLDVTAGEYVTIAVTDTGSGMSPETLERAFDPFFTTKEIGQGSGLGLSMVHGFARQSGGTAKIESALGAGTTVRIYLPRATPRVTAERGALAAPAAPARREETVLVLEDEAGVRQTVVALLTGLGYRVLEAASGGEALTIIRGPDPVDLLLSDIVLPGGLSGPEVGRQARSLRPGLRILYTSGYFASADEIVEKLDAPLLPKPYPHAELGRRIREILDSDPT
jgi:PAS domain S-box-containing protein